MIVVSSREFRDKQKNYLDQVDEGMEIVIQRGKNKSYKIVPVTAEDIVINKEHILVPDEDLYRAITMDELLTGVKQDLREMFSKGKE